MKRRLFICLAAFLAASACNPSACPGEEPARIVIYDRNYCVVSEVFSLELEPGISTLRREGMPAQLRRGSVNLEIKDAPEARILEQKYLPPADEDSLLKASEGKVIMFEITSPEGRRWLREGKIIRAGPDPMVEFDGMLRFGLPGKPLFESLPAGMYPEPAILWLIQSESPARTLAELTYITGGVNWEADYDIIFPGNDGRADLKGRFRITNASGKTFSEAGISLLAGDVGRRPDNRGMLMRSPAFEAAADASPAVSRAIDEYHIYSVKKPVTLADGEDARVEFIRAFGFETEREYIFDGASREKVQVFIEFKNSTENNLGRPLPGGRIRIYRAEEGFRILTGEDSIPHTPEGEKLRLYTGTAFDLAGERRQTAHRNISPREREEEYEIVLRNRKNEDVIISVLERPPHMDWEVRAASEDYEKVDARTLKFRIPVPAGGESKVSYAVRLRW